MACNSVPQIMAASAMATSTGVDATRILTHFLVLCQVLSALIQTSESFNTTYMQEDLNGDCWQYIKYRGGLIYSHAGFGNYADNADCKVTITTEPRKKVRVHFDTFDLSKSINCYQDEIVVYDGKTFSSLLLSGTPYGLCGNSLPTQYKVMSSTGNVLTVRFITDTIPSDNQGFSIIYTTIVPKELQTDTNSCFQCVDDDICIENGLVCDGLDNCLDGSDEDFSLCYENPDDYESFGWLAWMGTIFGVIVAFVVVIIVAIAVIICCCCRNPRHQHQHARSNHHHHHHHYNNNTNGSAHPPGYAVQVQQQNGRSGGYVPPSRYGPSQITSGYASSEDGYFGNNSVAYHAGHQTVVALPPKA